MPPVLVPIAVVALIVLTSARASPVENIASEPSASPFSEVTSDIHIPDGLKEAPYTKGPKSSNVPDTTEKPSDKTVSEQQAASEVTEDAGLLDKKLSSTPLPPPQPDVTDEEVVQSIHNASGAPQETKNSEGDMLPTEGTISEEVKTEEPSNKAVSEQQAVSKVMEDAGLLDMKLPSTPLPPQPYITDEEVVQIIHNASAALQERMNSEGDMLPTKGTVSDEVDEDLLNLGLIHATTSARDSSSSTTEMDIEGSGMEDDDKRTQAPPSSSEKPDTRVPPFTGCTPSLCRDILRANITAEPSFAKVAGGDPVRFTCMQTSDFNQTGRWFILRWQGPNGTLGPLQEKHDGQRGRASVLSGQAVSDISGANYTCVPDVPTSCCNSVGVTVTLVVYDVPVYTTHMAVLGGLVLLLLLLCLALHETRRRRYQRVKTVDERDDEWEYDK